MLELLHKTKKLIKHLKHYLDGKIKGYRDTRDLDNKLKALLGTLVNIIGTGIIITIIVICFDSPTWRFISYGLLSAIIMYYIKWLRKIMIVKTINEIDKL